MTAIADNLERAVLACAFLQPALIRVGGVLSPEHFAREAHAEIWQSMLRIAAEDCHDVDLLTVEADLADRGVLHVLPGDIRHETLIGTAPHPYLLDLSDEHLDLRRFPRYVSGVARAWGKRQLQRIAASIQRGGTDDLEESMGKVQRQLKEIEQSLPSAGPVTGWAAMEADEDLEGIGGNPTGLRTLDRATNGGLVPGDLTVIGGRPGNGKTSLALSIAMNQLRAGMRVYLASLEMPRRQIWRKLGSMISGVPLKKLQRMQGLSADEHDRLAAARDEIASWKVHLTDAARTISEIERDYQRIAGTHGKPDLVIVDYLQLARWPGAKNRFEEVGQVSRALRLLALDHEVAVLALSQLSRAVEGRDSKIPQLSDLRQAGEIEQDASLVVMTVLPQQYAEYGTAEWHDAKGRGILNVAKNRHGEPGVLELAWIGEQTRFADLERRAAA